MDLPAVKEFTMKRYDKRTGKENKHCPMCGAEIILQPGPIMREGGKAFCNAAHAYEYRLSLEPINKQTQMGGI